MEVLTPKWSSSDICLRWRDLFFLRPLKTFIFEPKRALQSRTEESGVHVYTLNSTTFRAASLGTVTKIYFIFIGYWSRQQAYRLKGKSREMITCWWTDSTHNWRQLLLPLEPTVAWTFGRDAVDEHLHLPTDIMGLQQKNTVVAVRHVKNRADT